MADQKSGVGIVRGQWLVVANLHKVLAREVGITTLFFLNHLAG